MKNLIILISFSTLMVTAPAQVDRWTSCEDLEITKMQFDQTTGNDTLYVTVYNDCDSCIINAYTGILVMANDDTLATTRNVTGRPAPRNNSFFTYDLYPKNGKFDLLTSLKVEMYLVCDSIPFAPDVVLSSNEESIKDKKNVFLQSNNILISGPGLAIQDISVYSMSGQLVQRTSGIFSSEYQIKIGTTGVYLVSVTLSNNEVVNLKYYEPGF